MLIVSFCTDDAHYRKYHDAFRRNCDEHGLEHDVRLIPAISKDKVSACCYRPQFIQELMAEHDRSLLWVDADGVIHAPFSVDDDLDVGFCDNPLNNGLKRTAGIMAFGNTPGGHEFLEAWRVSCEAYRKGGPTSHGKMEDLADQMTHLNQKNITDSLRGKITFYGAKGRLAIPV